MTIPYQPAMDTLLGMARPSSWRRAVSGDEFGWINGDTGQFVVGDAPPDAVAGPTIIAADIRPGDGFARNPETGQMQQAYARYGFNGDGNGGDYTDYSFEPAPGRNSLAGWAPGYYNGNDGGFLDKLSSFVSKASGAAQTLTGNPLGIPGLDRNMVERPTDVGHYSPVTKGAGLATLALMGAPAAAAEGTAGAGATAASTGGAAAAGGGGMTAAEMMANFGAEEAGQGALMQAADPAIGSAATGTGMWAGNTFNGGQVVPFGAAGDLAAPAAAAPAAAPAATPMPPAVVDPAAVNGGASMFEDIAKTVGSAIGTPLALIAGSSLLGGKMQADATSDAARIQAAATDRGIAEQARQYDASRSDLAPYRQAGTTALTNIGTAIGPDGTSGPLSRKFSLDDFWKDPVVQLGYQSGLDLGTKALRNAAPLTTGIDSGAAMKELTKFGTDYTGMKAGESYNRFVGDQGNAFNKLAAMAGIGQTATNTGVAAGTNAANNTAAMLTAQGNAGAASRIGGANAWSGALNNISNWWQSQNMLNRMFPQGA